jgi:hypothetical protein
MSVPADAIARLQDIVAACTSVTFKSAQDYPVDNIEPFPFSVAYIGGGTWRKVNSTTVIILPVINWELHFSRVNIKQAHQQIDALCIEIPRRLSADPTLNGTVDTIVMDEPLVMEVRPFVWSATVTSEMLKFSIPIKTLQTPLS